MDIVKYEIFAKIQVNTEILNDVFLVQVVWHVILWKTASTFAALDSWLFNHPS